MCATHTHIYIHTISIYLWLNNPVKKYTRISRLLANPASLVYDIQSLRSHQWLLLDRSLSSLSAM